MHERKRHKQDKSPHQHQHQQLQAYSFAGIPFVVAVLFEFGFVTHSLLVRDSVPRLPKTEAVVWIRRGPRRQQTGEGEQEPEPEAETPKIP
jgi:hypothetical protein